MKTQTIIVIGSLFLQECGASKIKDYREKEMINRSMQETVGVGTCGTLIPPSPLPPDDSSCWQWYTPPEDGVLPPGSPPPPTGCDYEPCRAAVCGCDDYCCTTAWDLSCRGYEVQAGDNLENNYFVAGCSARILCCEPESAFPKPPVGGALPPGPGAGQQVPLSNEFACTPGSEGCCDTMIPPSFLPPDDSSCWQWWTAPGDGVLTADSPQPFTGCDYAPCEAAVCACDSYCCETAWDLSCRGYQLASGDNEENNFFVDGCSAMLLCCEPPSAFPKPPVGGAVAPSTDTSSQFTYNVNVNQKTEVKKTTTIETSTKKTTFANGETVKEIAGGTVVKNEFGANVYFMQGKKDGNGKKEGKKGKKGETLMPTPAPTPAMFPTTSAPTMSPSSPPTFVTTSTLSATLSVSQTLSSSVTLSASDSASASASVSASAT